jgi:hypothetical protein
MRVARKVILTDCQNKMFNLSISWEFFIYLILNKFYGFMVRKIC